MYVSDDECKIRNYDKKTEIDMIDTLHKSPDIYNKTQKNLLSNIRTDEIRVFEVLSLQSMLRIFKREYYLSSAERMYIFEYNIKKNDIKAPGKDFHDLIFWLIENEDFMCAKYVCIEALYQHEGYLLVYADVINICRLRGEYKTAIPYVEYFKRVGIDKWNDKYIYDSIFEWCMGCADDNINKGEYYDEAIKVAQSRQKRYIYDEYGYVQEVCALVKKGKIKSAEDKLRECIMGAPVEIEKEDVKARLRCPELCYLYLNGEEFLKYRDDYDLINIVAEIGYKFDSEHKTFFWERLIYSEQRLTERLTKANNYLEYMDDLVPKIVEKMRMKITE